MVPGVTEADEAEGPGRPGRIRRWAALLAPVGAALVWSMDLGLEPKAHSLAGIFVAVIVLWVTEIVPIAVTALAIAPAMVLLGVCDEKQAFAPYADPLLFLFVGGFMIARSMTRHGLDRRIALGLVSLRIIRGVPTRVRAAFMMSALLISMWISNTATTAILVPILLGLLDDHAGGADRRSQTGSLLAVAYAASLGGLGTPVGSPPNLIAMRFLEEAGHRLSFFDWMSLGLPVAILLTIATFVLFQRPFPPMIVGAGDAPREAKPWSRGERVTAFAFGIAVVGWMTPGILDAAGASFAHAVDDALPGGVVAIVAASVLFFVPDTGGREPVLPWHDAVRIDWGLILLFGGGISLGKQMFDTGLAEAISRGFVALTGVHDLWTLTALVTVFTIFFTETCSNTATSNMLSPLVVAVASELGVSPVPPVLGVGLAASCAFMLPIATGPNAIVYGTGRVDQPTMIRMGFWLNLVAAALIFVLLRILCPIYGWT